MTPKQEAAKKYYRANRAKILLRTKEYYKAHSISIKIYIQGWQAANPERTRDAKYKSGRRASFRRYGLTESSFRALLQEQGGTCGICKSPDWGKKGPVIDHSHATGQVRGILCNEHNLALGLFNDDPALLRAAADYLEKSYE